MSTTTFNKMLTKYGDGYPSNEHAIFSVTVLKINKRQKSQKRILLLTNKALYNIKPTNITTCQRRIAYDMIEYISLSTTSTEFVVHVPQEYDYRYKSGYAKTICKELQKLCNKYTNTKTTLIRTIQNTVDLSLITCSKSQTQKLSAPQIRKRLQFYYNLTEHGSDNRRMSDINEKMYLKLTNNQNIFGEEYASDNTEIDDINNYNDGDIVGDINTIFHIGEDSINVSKVLKLPQTRRQYMYTTSELLIVGFLRMGSIDLAFKMDIIPSIMDCCLLYLSDITGECFDNCTDNIWSDLVTFSDKNQTIALYDENGQTVYGKYRIETGENDSVYKWKLRVNDFDKYNGSIWIGIDSVEETKATYIERFSRFNDSDNYSFGGNRLMGYHVWNRDKLIASVAKDRRKYLMIESGDCIEIILVLKQKMLKFVVNEETYVINNIPTMDKTYRLAVYLSHLSISLKGFNIFHTLSS